MGLQISYDLAADAEAEPAALLEPLRGYAATLPFADVSDLVSGPQRELPIYGDSDWMLPLDEQRRIRPQESEPGDDSSHEYVSVRATEWTAFRVDPGRECEIAYFGLARYPATWRVDGELQPTGLDRSWRWHFSCKTSVASNVSSEHFMRCHGSLISLLDFAVEIGLAAGVRDDTGFWEHRDWNAAFNELSNMYGSIADAVARFLFGPPGSEAYQQAASDLRRKFPPEPSPH